MLRSMVPAVLCLSLLSACETSPKVAGQAVTAPAATDEPAMAPLRREPCGDGPVMLPTDPPRQTGVVTSTGEPIE